MESEELAGRCLELARHLASTGQCFRLSINLTNPDTPSATFNFHAESGDPTLLGLEKNERMEKNKKRKTKKLPSVRRRDEKRKEEFLRRKQNSTSIVTPASPTFHSIPPTGIPQWEGNSTLICTCQSEDDDRTEGIPGPNYVPPNPSVWREYPVWFCSKCDFNSIWIEDISVHDEKQCQEYISRAKKDTLEGVGKS